MSALCRRHYGISLDELGWVENDDTVWLSVRRRKPLLVDSPTSKAARNIERIARRVAALTAAKQDYREQPPPAPLETPDHYTVLGIGRSSNDEEIRRAFKRQREVYATGGLATTSLLDDLELSGAQARIDEAHDTLARSGASPRLRPLDVPRGRRPLAVEHHAAPGARRRAAHAPGRARARDRARHRVHRRAAPQGARVAGHRARRDQLAHEDLALASRGASKRTVYADLPAIVYVRGFVTELAKYLPPRSRSGPAHVPATDAREERVVNGDERAGQDRRRPSDSRRRRSSWPSASGCSSWRWRSACTWRARSPASRCGTATITTSARDTSRAASATPTR